MKCRSRDAPEKSGVYDPLDLVSEYSQLRRRGIHQGVIRSDTLGHLDLLQNMPRYTWECVVVEPRDGRRVRLCTSRGTLIGVNLRYYPRSM
jgi:hypothetical protein